jgi:hypothetical protein
MTKISTIVAAVARFPVNFFADVGKDIKTLNEQAAVKPPKLDDLTEEEVQGLLKRRAQRAQQGTGK